MSSVCTWNVAGSIPRLWSNTFPVATVRTLMQPKSKPVLVTCVLAERLRSLFITSHPTVSFTGTFATTPASASIPSSSRSSSKRSALVPPMACTPTTEAMLAWTSNTVTSYHTFRLRSSTEGEKVMLSIWGVSGNTSTA